MSPVAGIKRGFPNQSMDAGFCSEPAIGVFAFKANGSAFDAGNIASGLFDEFSFEAAAFAPSEVHPLYHGCPVLSFSAPGSCLNVEESVAVVHLTRKHPAKFKFCDNFFKTFKVKSDQINAVFVLLRDGQFQKFCSLLNTPIHLDQVIDHRFELGSLLAEGLGPFRIIPDFGILKFPKDFGQSFLFVLEVKDTP